MASCIRCNTRGTFFGETKIDEYTGMCRKCTTEIRNATIAGIRMGRLPSYSTSVRLSAGELCHLEMAATYHRKTRSGVTLVQGRFVATSAKLHFLAQTGTYTISWNSVLRVLPVVKKKDQLYLELDRQGGTGYYTVPDAELAILLFDTLTQMTKRQLLIPKGNSRQIPQHIRTAVWQRDGGRCVECGSNEYLEFDHIIPFSKGGATSVDNLQLLCRKCNARKSSRI